MVNPTPGIGNTPPAYYSSADFDSSGDDKMSSDFDEDNGVEVNQEAEFGAQQREVTPSEYQNNLDNTPHNQIKPFARKINGTPTIAREVKQYEGPVYNVDLTGP